MSGLSRLSGRGAAALASLALTLALALCAPGEARGQWAPSPSNGDSIHNTNAGGVGVGTNSPGNYRLHVFGVGSSVEAMVANFFGTHNNLLESQSGVKVGLLNNYHSQSGVAEMARGVVTLGYSNGGGSDLTGYYSRQRVWHNNAVAQGVYAIAEADSFGSAGQRLYGGRFKAKTTDVTGGAITGASVSATFQDVAEWVPSVQRLAAGTVVVLDADRTNHVVVSGRPYDTAVAGVVSAEPGVLLGVAARAR